MKKEQKIKVDENERVEIEKPSSSYRPFEKFFKDQKSTNKEK